ncbi:MAG: immune inhibitor A [Muribaculaceae bacterium]|nr:immune inhibitor A [Muribaculaceae bacterium]
MKNFLLSLAAVAFAGLGMTAAPITVSLAETDTFTGMTGEEETVVEKTLDGVNFSFFHCKNYKDYLMVCSSKYEGAYMEFSAEVEVSSFQVHTGSNASGKVLVSLTCNGEAVSEYTNIQIPKASDYIFTIPADMQAAGTKYRLTASVANAQYTVVILNPEGEVKPPVDPEPPVDPDVVFENTFENDLTGFTVKNMIENDYQGWRMNNNTPKCAIANSYVSGKNLEASSWLISNPIDLKDRSQCTLSFEQGFGFTFPTAQESNYTVLARDPESETEAWTNLTMTNFPAVPESGNWTKEWAVNTFDLSEFAGKKVEISLVYENDGSKSRAWEIKNFVVKGKKATNVDEISTSLEAPTYYTLQGVKVVNPENGLYIVVKNGKASKVLVK